MLKQTGDMQKRRFAGARRRNQRDRLPRPKRQLDAIEYMKRLVTLSVLTLDILQEQDRDILFLASLRRLFLLLAHCGPGYAVSLTHSAAPPPDRDAPHATTDKAWQVTTAQAPSLRLPWSHRSPSVPAGAKGNTARAKTARYWSTRIRIVGCSQC